VKLALRAAAMGLAIAVLILSVVNASWLADTPRGKPTLVAHRGVAQVFDRTAVERDTCTATRIEQPYHQFLENTADGAIRAVRLGAHVIEADVAPTADGDMVVFHDWDLDCRTNGRGPVREATVEQLEALDVGYGYTADGGKTFPFRGKGVGKMPTVEEFARAVPRPGRILYNFKSDDPAEADLLVAKLKAAGRDPVAKRDGFYGAAKPVARIRELLPEVWAWTPAEARQCSEDYVTYGWTSIVPDSCKGRTMVIPLNYQFAFWGWPNRLIARIEEHGGEIIVTGPHADGEPNTGLLLPEQLGDIPGSFNGFIWIEDAYTILPARVPSLDTRRDKDIEAAEAALARRREAQ